MAKRKKNRRKMPAALRAYWAKKRTTKARRARAVAVTIKGAPAVARRKKRSTRKSNAFGSSRSGFMPPGALLAIAGTIGGALVGKIVTDRLAASSGKMGELARSPIGRVGAGVAVGAGLYMLGKRMNRTAAAAAFAGAVASPAATVVSGAINPRGSLSGYLPDALSGGLFGEDDHALSGYLPDALSGYLPDALSGDELEGDDDMHGLGAINYFESE